MPRPELRERLVARLTERPARSQFLRGGMGIGKTTLAAEVNEQLRRRGRRVVPIVAVEELAGVPLAALAPVLNARVVASSGSEIGDRVHALVGLLGSAPTEYVLIVDDAPMLDSVSASVVYQLIRVFGVPALLTARDEHEIVGPIARLLHEDLLTVTDVAPLAAAEVTELVERRLERAVRPESASALLTACQGNPLFLRELVLSAERSGRVREGRFGLEVDIVGLPSHVLGTVTDRLERLDSDELQMARMLALSQPWSHELAEGYNADVLRRLRAGGMLSGVADGSVRLGHPLYAEALIAALSVADRARLLAEAATVLRGTGVDVDRFTAACLLLETDTSGGSEAREREWASGFAIAAGDPASAVRLARAAEKSAAGFRVALLLAVAYSALGEIEEANATFARAADFAEDGEQVALVALRWGQHIAYRLRDPVAAVSRATEMVAGREPQLRAALDAEVVKWRLMSGEPISGTLTVGDREAEDILGRLATGVTEAMLATMRGDSFTARAAIERTRPLVELVRVDQPHAGDLLDLSELLTEIADCRIDRAREIAQRQRTEGNPDGAGVWSYILSLIELHAGRPDLAEPLAALAVRQLEWRDFTGLFDVALALAATLDEMTRALVSEAEPAQSTSPGDVKVVLQSAEATAWRLTRTARADEAGSILRDAVGMGVSQHHHLLAALTASVAVRVGRADDVRSALTDATALTSAPFVHLVAEAATASAVDDHRAAVALVPRLREAGLSALARRLMENAVKGATADGDVHRRARMYLADLAGVTCAEPSGRSGIELDGTTLSAREWEVARAAASRERSKEIAARLGLSVKTVENHLSSVYRKLGVSGRDELTIVLRESGLSSVSP